MRGRNGQSVKLCEFLFAGLGAHAANWASEEDDLLDGSLVAFGMRTASDFHADKDTE